MDGATVRRFGLAALLAAMGALWSWNPIQAKARDPYASIVIDAQSGAVVSENAPDEPRYPASLTKMMTLYMVFEAIETGHIRMAGRWPVSTHAAAQPPTKLGLEEGDLVQVRDIVLGMIVKSANDAAVVAAEALGGSEQRFADMMTQRARRLGMTSTVFQNASGLPDPAQITTARDVATLGRALYRDFPRHYALFATTEFSYRGKEMRSHNRMMGWYTGVDGIKTGYTRASGFNLVTSVERDGRRLIGAVIGGPSAPERDREMARILDAAYGELPTKSAAAAKNAKSASRKTDSAPAGTATGSKSRKGKTADKPSQRADSETAAGPQPTTGDWAIQVGAFPSAATARRVAVEAKERGPAWLKMASLDVASLERGPRPLFRARLVGLSPDAARAACRVLEARKLDCIALSPEQAGAVNIARH